MRQITTLNDSYKQTFKFALEGYDDIQIYLEFKPLQYAWFITINWGVFSLNNERVSVSPNLLRQFSRIVPFGIAISGPDAVDPFSNDAWLNGWSFYMLDEIDMADVEAIYVK